MNVEHMTRISVFYWCKETGKQLGTFNIFFTLSEANLKILFFYFRLQFLKRTQFSRPRRCSSPTGRRCPPRPKTLSASVCVTAKRTAWTCGKWPRTSTWVRRCRGSSKRSRSNSWRRPRSSSTPPRHPRTNSNTSKILLSFSRRSTEKLRIVKKWEVGGAWGKAGIQGYNYEGGGVEFENRLR